MKLRDDTYEAYYDADSGEWPDDKCSDLECEFCKDRPDNAKALLGRPLRVSESGVVPTRAGERPAEDAIA